METVAKENEGYDDQNDRDRDGFDPEHQAGGNFDVAPGDPDGDAGDEQGEKNGGEDVAGGVAQQKICEMVEAADDARGGRDVGEKQTPGGDGAEPRRKNHRA